jgi:hypothetical protein
MIMWEFKTAQFRVVWSIYECVNLDLSWVENSRSIRASIDDGTYTAFDSKVTVYHDNKEIGSDTLGQSIYENPADFRDHIGAQGKHGSYFTDMITIAIKAARQNMRQARPYIRE